MHSKIGVSYIQSSRKTATKQNNNNNEKNGNNTYKYSGLIGDLKRSKVIQSGNKNRQESDLYNDCYDIESWLYLSKWKFNKLRGVSHVAFSNCLFSYVFDKW